MKQYSCLTRHQCGIRSKVFTSHLWLIRNMMSISYLSHILKKIRMVRSEKLTMKLICFRKVSQSRCSTIMMFLCVNPMSYLYIIRMTSSTMSHLFIHRAIHMNLRNIQGVSYMFRIMRLRAAWRWHSRRCRHIIMRTILWRSQKNISDILIRRFHVRNLLWRALRNLIM